MIPSSLMKIHTFNLKGTPQPTISGKHNVMCCYVAKAIYQEKNP